MRILAIETATDRCGVAVLEDTRVVANLMLARPRSHAEYLVPMIDQALGLAQWTAASLDAVAVSMGPGSYTGLRIGVSTAKGLAFATNTRLIGVRSLEALARAAAPFAHVGDIVVPAFGARRDEVYIEAYRVAARPGDSGALREPKQGHRDALEPLGETAAIPVVEIADWLPEVETGVVLVGDAAPAVDAVLPDHVRGRSTVLSLLPDAEFIGLQGFAQRDAPPIDLSAFEPFYLKEFIAKKPTRTIFDRLPF